MSKKTKIILIIFITVSILAGYIIINNDEQNSSFISNETNQIKVTNIIEDIIATSTTLGNTEVKSSSIGNPIITNIILFYGDGCPHCKIVEEFIENNNIKNKISFAQKEVYNNKKNADELVGKAKICGIPTDSIGVPFLWDGTKCLVGDQDIVDFFKSLIN